MSTTIIESKTQPRKHTTPGTDQCRHQGRQPRYHVILHDDDDHSYEYVIGMLRRLFGYSHQRAYDLARETDETGAVVVDTTTLERAELKRDQIHAFGRDWRIARCTGSMTATIEPAE